MTEGELARGVARGLHMAASLSVFGAALFRALIAPPALGLARGAAPRISRRLVRLAWWSLLAAVIAGAAWLLLEAAYIGDAGSAGEALGLVPPVLWETNFGHVLMIRTGLVVLAILVLGDGDGAGARRAGFAALLAGAAAALESALDHGASMPGRLGEFLWGSTAIHIIAAGAWLGGLIPLLLLAGAAPPLAARAAGRRFSSLGTVCVAAIALTAVAQSVVLAGGVKGLLFTDYGEVVLAKIMLFSQLLCLAAINRFWLTPRLGGPGAAIAQRHFLTSLKLETALGLAVVLAAGILLNLTPGMDRHAMGNG